MNASPQPSPSRPKLLTQITSANLGLELPRLDDKPTDEAGKKALAEKIALWAHVYDLGGRVRGSKATKGKGDKDGVKFIGEFRARLADHLGGTWYVSGRAHVPTVFEEMLYAQLVGAQELARANQSADNGGISDSGMVEFLVRVGIKPPKPGKPSAVGYEWTVEPLVETERASDPVMGLFDRLETQTQTALPPPTVTQTDLPNTDPVASMASGEESVVSQARRGRR